MTDAASTQTTVDDAAQKAGSGNAPKTLHRMPKSSSLSGPSGDRSKSVGGSDVAEDMKKATLNVQNNGAGSGTERDLAREEMSPPPPPKSPSSPSQFKNVLSNARQGKTQNGSSSNQPQRKFGAASLTADTSSNNPYGRSPASSAASLSHNNMLETASINSGSIADSNNPEDDVGRTAKSNSLPRVETENLSQRRANNNKHKFPNILSRSRSIKTEEALSSRGPGKPTRRNLAPSRDHVSPSDNPHTAPLEPDRTFREMMDSSHRNRSADRMAVESEDEAPKPPSSSSAQGPGLLSGFVHTSSRAADGIGRAGNRFFGKFARSGSSHEREPVPENYVFKVINLPLVEQTRATRLKKHMDLARDKTEFWMPALPYRCIDFLNHHGVEVEGLYRIPGSGREIKQWQIKFDTGPTYDVDLLDDNIELYDINVVGSMLKTWLRDLPDELLPKAIQNKISAQCQGAEETPQLMRDELSKLPPFNYYLLFAITCHISLMNSHSDKNKMNFHNLCVCFQPSLKVDGFCFQFLVMDWRNCWQGCWTEKETLEEETRLAQEPPRGNNPPQPVNGTSSSTKKNEQWQTAETRAPAAPPKSRSAGNGIVPAAHKRQETRPEKIKEKENIDTPFSQDLGSRSSSRRPSTPPSLSPVTKVSPMRM
ncbi:MAG: hypothetical protein M1828_000085 [Chrysothrix sp. TS-e1954]|nr:MAG: hypothetical protein M1828_000085 [Chrysothrix sp. TS-e1954]